MKHYLSGIVIALSLALVLVLGVVALAENAPETPELPAAGELQAPEQNEAPAPTEDAQSTQDDNAALQEALEAYRSARESAHEEALQAELDGYVAAGKLTQAQADLIMNYYKERQSMRNGTCPSCGYQFQNGNGGRMNGRGGKGGRMGGMNGGFGGKGGRMGSMYGDFGGMVPGTPNGMSAQPDQAAPQAFGSEGI